MCLKLLEELINLSFQDLGNVLPLAVFFFFLVLLVVFFVLHLSDVTLAWLESLGLSLAKLAKRRSETLRRRLLACFS